MAESTELEPPLAEKALHHLVCLVKGITTDAGYYTNIGKGEIATEPMQEPEGDDALTLIFPTEVAANAEATGPRTRASNMLVTMQVIVPMKCRKPTQMALRVIADLHRVLMSRMRDGRPGGVRTIAVEGAQRVIYDHELYLNSVVAQVAVRVGLSESF